MSPRRVHPALVWLCLITFGLTITALTGGVFVCHDGHGNSRFEWGGCERTSDGECAVSCGAESEDDQGVPHPCEDAPLPGQERFTKAPSRAGGDLPIPVMIVVAAIIDWGNTPTSTGVVRAACVPPRPPDPLRLIRAIVLLV